MQLSSEQFERIVGKVDPLPAEEAANKVMLPDGTFAINRRKETRIPFGQRAKIRVNQVENAADWSTVMLQDISIQSVSFLCSEEISINSEFILCLKDQAGSLVTFKCVAKRSEAGGFGGTSFTIGAQFAELLTETTRPGSTSTDESADAITDPFEAYGTAILQPIAAKSKGMGVSRVLNSLNPARLWSHLTKEYDDFSTCSAGANLSDCNLSDIARTIENSDGPAHPNRAIARVSTLSSPGRRSSIFLHEQPAEEKNVEPVVPAESVTPSLEAAIELPKTPITAPVESAMPAALPELSVAISEPAPQLVISTPAIQSPEPIIASPAAPTLSGSDDLLGYRAWAKHSLAGKRFTYMWAAELSMGSQPTDPKLMVLVGAFENLKPEILALQVANETTAAQWKQLLINLMRRGLTKAPKLAIGDRKLAFWTALKEFAPGTLRQYSWEHQISYILHLLPAGFRRLVEKELREISNLPTRDAAIRALELLGQDLQCLTPEATTCIQEEKNELLSFHDFPRDTAITIRDTVAIHRMFESSVSLQHDSSMQPEVTLAKILSATGYLPEVQTNKTSAAA